MIRDVLGHTAGKTTQISARANRERKRKALEKISDPSPVPKLPSWQANKTLLAWLQSLYPFAGHVCPVVTEGYQPRVDFYGEYQQLKPLAIKDLGGFTAHNNCLHTIAHRGLHILVPE